MQRVLGIGGLFFRAEDPKALADWYDRVLGVAPVPSDYETDAWRQSGGHTVFAPFAQDTTYFRHPNKQFMINFRVECLDAMVEQVRKAGTEVEVDPETYPNGRFAFLTDPEGNPIQLWEPIGRSRDAEERVD